MSHEPDIEEVDESEILADIQFEQGINSLVMTGSITPAPPPAAPTDKNEKEASYTQWALGGNGRFSPVGSSTDLLPAGVYDPFTTPGSWGLERLSISSDEIYELPDMATNTVLSEAETFWDNEARYRKHSLLYKRGILLWGPPGSGKSVTLKLLMKKLIDRNGLIILVNNVGLANMCLKAIKRIEPTRNLICIFEDIDEILQLNGGALLSMLDGEHNVDRVMNIATTNYADRLGPRIINRPSRFDRRVFVGMPGIDARRHYLKMATCNSLDTATLDQWVVDTHDMSIAHLRELVVAVYCLDQAYADVIARLKEMATQVKIANEFKSRGLGFKKTFTGELN